MSLGHRDILRCLIFVYRCTVFRYMCYLNSMDMEFGSVGRSKEVCVSGGGVGWGGSRSWGFCSQDTPLLTLSTYP